MIRLINALPERDINTVELFKIYATHTAYPKETLIWSKEGTDVLISCLDGNMVISADSADEELKEFLRVISPASVFSSLDIISGLLPPPYEQAAVLSFCGEFEESIRKSDTLKSDEIYRLLDAPGLSLPPYEYFAPDFCHRLNHGQLEYFALKGLCAAISLRLNDTALINGIASHKKGYGGIALKELIRLENGKRIFVCAAPKIKNFYIKNGFEEIYTAAYWKRDEISK